MPLLAAEAHTSEAARPRVRGECRGGERPCPWASCRYHLAADVRGAVELEDMAETCALDVADRGGLSLADIARILNVTRERARQLEVEALAKLKVMPRAAELAREAEVLPASPRRSAPPAVRTTRRKLAPAGRRPARAVERRPRPPRSGRGRLQPNELVGCSKFGALVPLRTCLQRQDALWPGKRAPIHDYCGSGQCEQGADYRRRATYSAGADWAGKSKAGRAAYQFFRRDVGVQRQKRRLQALSRLVEVPTIDRPPGSQPEALALDLADPEVQEVLAAAGV